MKVLLVSVNRLTVPFPVYPLGLDHVAAALEPGHEVALLDLNLGAPDGDELEQALRAPGPDLVGLSVRNIDNTDLTEQQSFVEDLRRLVARIRAARAGVPVVLGGAGYSIFPAELLRGVGADYGIVGEGERLPLLLEALARGETRPADVPGLVLPGSDPVPLPPPLTAPRPRRLPTPSAQLDFYLRRGGMLSLQTKRGCPYSCIYCTYPLIEGRRPRLFAPAQVGREARALQEAGARFLWITDSLFNSHVEHSLAVGRALRQAGVSIPWGAFFAPFAPPDGYYAELAGCGLTHVEFGTEALSGPVLTAYRKSFGVDDVFAAHRAARAAGLALAHYYTLGGPGETRATLQETLQRAEGLERAVHFFFCGLRIYPGTGLQELALQEGQLDPARSLLAPCYYRSAALPPEEIPALVAAQAAGRTHWVVGSGGESSSRLVERLHRRGHVGPLWEKLVR